MKINLTKLLEKVDLKKSNDNERTTDASYYITGLGNDSTSLDNAYSFEFEKEEFNLKG